MYSCILVFLCIPPCGVPLWQTGRKLLKENPVFFRHLCFRSCHFSSVTCFITVHKTQNSFKLYGKPANSLSYGSQTMQSHEGGLVATAVTTRKKQGKVTLKSLDGASPCVQGNSCIPVFLYSLCIPPCVQGVYSPPVYRARIPVFLYSLRIPPCVQGVYSPLWFPL